MSETMIEAVPDLPVIRITRKFDAPAERVFRAHTDRDLFAQWIGPRSIDTTITEWEPTTGGRWAYRNSRAEDGLDTGFFGSFHEVRPNERIVQTFTYDGEQLGQGRENAKNFLSSNPEVMVEISDRVWQTVRPDADKDEAFGELDDEPISLDD